MTDVPCNSLIGFKICWVEYFAFEKKNKTKKNKNNISGVTAKESSYFVWQLGRNLETCCNTKDFQPEIGLLPKLTSCTEIIQIHGIELSSLFLICIKVKTV